MKYWIREVAMLSFSFLLKITSLVTPKRKNLVLFGAHNGNRFSDNSAILYSYILENCPDLIAVWLTNNDQVISEVKSIGGEAYKRRSIKGIYLSLTASAYFTSHSIKDVLMFVPINKRPKHIYLHHGIPLRKGWLNIDKAPKKSIRSTNAKIRATNYMIAPSKFAAEQQNKLLPIGLDKFAYTGLPRNDIFFDSSFDKISFKKKYDLDTFTKVILYAPTWRPWGATQFFPFSDYSLEQLSNFLQEKNICIVLRPHHVDLNGPSNANFWNSIKDHKNIKLITHETCANVNNLCMVSDALITDYSSIYYDYLIQDKPVVFLCYDFERYNAEIGFYSDFNDIAIGYKPNSQKLFLKALQDISMDMDLYNEGRNKLTDKFYLHLDGNSSKRVTDLVIDLIK